MSINRDNLDESIHPGDDFYHYANGGWLKRNPLPDEFSRYGSFDALADDNINKIRKLIEEVSITEADYGSIIQKVGDFYKSGMDEVKIEKEGISPLSEYLDEINSVTDTESLENLLVRWHSKNIQVLFSLYGMPDKTNSGMMIASLSQGGLGLTDIDYYLSDNEWSKNIRTKYAGYISRILCLSGIDTEIAHIQSINILDFETRIAKSSMSRLDRRDPFKVYNKISIQELKTMTPEINWDKLLSSLNLTAITEINVSQPLFFRAISEVLKDTEIETWKIWLRWTLINCHSHVLSSEFVTANFEFYGAFLSGKKSIQPRWKRIIANCNNALGEAIGELFVEKYFPPESKKRMLVLVGNLKSALEDRINQLDWMSDSTKKEALEKLKVIDVKIGYPDKWRDYKDLEIKNISYFENVRNASCFNYLFYISKIGHPVDKTEWGMTPQTVNAYYNPSGNEIVFPAAILQPPFFYPDTDDAVNYGAIGMVIGHELTHGFDDQGRNYDKNGNLANWWLDIDSEKFIEKTKVIVEQFNGFKINNYISADGRLTLGENIADLGGLNIAFSALNKAWNQNPPEQMTDGFTPSQRFFLSYAHVWANNINEEEMLRRTKEDVHSLGHLRVNGPLQHMQEFIVAFKVNPGDPMYIPYDKRAHIW